MRSALSILLAVLAGLLAALSLVGARAEALVYTPGPLQEIAGPMAADPTLRGTLPEELAALVQEQLPDELPGFLQAGAARIVQGAADGLVTDERFPAAWSEVLESTRADWVARIDHLAQDLPTPAGAAGTATAPAESGTVHLQTAPLVDLGLDRLSDSLSDSLSNVPGGEAVAETLREGVVNASADSGESLRSVDLTVPDPDTVPLEAMVLTVDNLHRWPWLAGSAAVLAVLALLVAPRRRKGTPLCAAGITLLAAGVGSRWALERMAPAEDVAGVARAAAASLLEGIRDYAMPDTLILMVGGAGIAVLGLVVALLSGLRPGPGTGRGTARP
jgi:hypothetical protein